MLSRFCMVVPDMCTLYLCLLGGEIHVLWWPNPTHPQSNQSTHHSPVGTGICPLYQRATLGRSPAHLFLAPCIVVHFSEEAGQEVPLLS